MNASDTYAVTTGDATRHTSGKPFNGTLFSVKFFLFNHNTLYLHVSAHCTTLTALHIITL